MALSSMMVPGLPWRNQTKIPIVDIKVKRHINPRFELDSDYVDELVSIRGYNYPEYIKKAHFVVAFSRRV